MAAAAATEGDILIKNVIPKHMEAITAKLSEMGVIVLEEDDGIRVIGKHPLKAVNVMTMPYPGFPTDLQQPMAVLMTIAQGTSTITESILKADLNTWTNYDGWGPIFRLIVEPPVLPG